MHQPMPFDRQDESQAPMCGVPDCDQRVIASTAPLCEPHMIEAWRWVEAHPSVKPPTRVTDGPHPANIATPEDEHVVFYARLPDGDIRIGATYQLERRFRALGLPYPGALLATERGGYLLKQRRHEQFAAARRPADGKAAEVFAPSPELLGHLDTMAQFCRGI